jgi:hypothetical protein
MAIRNGWLRLIFQNCPKNNYVDKWQLMIGLFTSCKRMVNSYKCYTLIKDGSVYSQKALKIKDIAH